MQNIAIVWRASLIYLVKAMAGTEVSKTGAFGRLALLDTGVSCSESLSSSG